MNDRPTNGSNEQQQQPTLTEAIQIFGNAFLQSKIVNGQLVIDPGQFAAQGKIVAVTLDFVAEILCQRTGLSIPDFQAALAQRLLNLAQTFPQPQRIQVAGGMPRKQ